MGTGEGDDEGDDDDEVPNACSKAGEGDGGRFMPGAGETEEELGVELDSDLNPELMLLLRDAGVGE
jgi:hypothetical protein